MPIVLYRRTDKCLVYLRWCFRRGTRIARTESILQLARVQGSHKLRARFKVCHARARGPSSISACSHFLVPQGRKGMFFSFDSRSGNYLRPRRISLRPGTASCKSNCINIFITVAASYRERIWFEFPRLPFHSANFAVSVIISRWLVVTFTRPICRVI